MNGVKFFKEKEAFEVLSKDVPNMAKNSFREACRFVLSNFCRDHDAFEIPTFCPDGTRIQIRPQNYTFKNSDVVLEIWEIESTQQISQDKMDKFQRFGSTLFDNADVLLEVWTVNRFGKHPTLVYSSIEDNWH